MTGKQNFNYRNLHYFPKPFVLDGLPWYAQTVETDRIAVDMLQEAYWHGYFPWPDGEGFPIPWAHPDPRGVIAVDEFHIPKTVLRLMKKDLFEFRIDTAFDQVIRNCAERNNGEDTWITDAIIPAYCALHRAGWAHSFEAWDKETGVLAGGLYGISIGQIFAGESMFYRKTGASKFALASLGLLLKQCGVKLLDTQMVTPTTELFGAVMISRNHYLKLLKQLRGEPLSTEQFRAAAAAMNP